MTFIQIKFAQLYLCGRERYIRKVIEVKIRQLHPTDCLEHFSSEKINNTRNKFEPDFS